MTKGDVNKNITVTQEFIDKLIDKIGKILKEQHTLVERDEEQEESIEFLLEKVSSLEKNFEELTKSLAKGSYPLKLARSIKAAPSSIKPHIVPVDLTKAQLIATYNELVAVLSGYIIPVTLTPDSYRGSNSDGIILETTIKGNYWAIATLENKQHKYWLVPNNNISFNIHKLKTVENLFQLQGDYNSLESEFILQEPAILSLLPNNKQWKLIQPGILFFGSRKSASPQLKQPENVVDDKQSKIDRQISSSLVAFQTTIDKLNSKISQLEIKSEISDKVHQRDKQEWLAEKQVFNEKLQKNDILQSQLTNFINHGDRTKNYDLTLTKFQTIIAQLTNKIAQLETQSELSQKTYQRDKQEWLAEKQVFNEQLQKNAASQSQLNNFINQGDRIASFDSIENLQQTLSKADLAIIKSLKSDLDKMADTVRRYHADHHASKEEADIIANYLLKASNLIDNIKTHNDLIELFEYLIALKGKISQYNHRKHKYCWSVILENEVMTKLQKISILQSYQSDKFDRSIRQQALNLSTGQINTVVESENNQNEENDLKTKISRFRQDYTQDIKLISDRIVAKVVISVETLAKITFYKPDVIILENTPHGKYWIVDYLGAYFLIPSEIEQITNATETSLTVAKILFDLVGYYPQYSAHYLIKPAIVTKLSTNQWKLEEKGKFNFS